MQSHFKLLQPKDSWIHHKSFFLSKKKFSHKSFRDLVFTLSFRNFIALKALINTISFPSHLIQHQYNTNISNNQILKKLLEFSLMKKFRKTLPLMAQQLFNVRCAYNLHISRYLAACCIIIYSMRIVNGQNSDKNRPHFLQQQSQLSAWSVVNAQWTDHQEFTKRQHCYLIGTVVYKFQFSCCISFFSTKSISFNYLFELS